MFESLGGDVLKVPVSGSAVLRGGGEWRPSGTPGFWVKPLVEDAEAGLRTWLMKSDPGASSKLHSHDEIEQIYVLEGSFAAGETSQTIIEKRPETCWRTNRATKQKFRIC